MNVLTLFKKEFKSYFNSAIAYIALACFLAISSFLFFMDFFLFNQATMRGFFMFLPWIFLFLIPAITMRSWAEEKKLGTIETLMTLPVKDYEAVTGKYLASLAFLAIGIALTVTVPLTIAILGEPDSGPIIGGYLGALLMGSTYLAIGHWMSSLTRDQIVAFIGSLSVIFVLLLIGESFIFAALPDALVPFAEYLGLGSHFRNIGRGVIDTRDIVYYLSMTGLFIYLNIQNIRRRKW